MLLSAIFASISFFAVLAALAALAVLFLVVKGPLFCAWIDVVNPLSKRVKCAIENAFSHFFHEGSKPMKIVNGC